MEKTQSHAKVVVVGGGIMGVSLLYPLAKEGWKEKRYTGKIGEEEVSDYIKNSGYQVLDLNYNSPDDTRSGIENWREYQKLPDGVAKNEKEF